MITPKEIEDLAKLARIKVDESEKKELAKDIDSILVYIDQIKSATLDTDHIPDTADVSNVFAEDIAKPVSMEDRDRLLDEAPDREGDFVAVKKIIAQDNDE